MIPEKVIEMTANEKLQEIGKQFQQMGTHMPSYNEKFMEFSKEMFKGDAISQKNKELMAVAVSVVQQCEWCIVYHVKQSLELGASEQELREAGYVAAGLGGGPAAMHMIIIEKAISDFKED